MGVLIDPLTYADNVELLRFIPDLLPALFAMFDSTSDWKADFKKVTLKWFVQITEKSNVFHSYSIIVLIISLLIDERNKLFQPYRSVLDDFIDNHFEGIF